MNTNEMIAILTINQEGNISKAADFLGISQPALSKILRTLESRLDIKFFKRLPRGVQLTKEGEIYIEKFQNILTELEEAKTEVKKLHSDFTDSLTLSVHPILGKYIIPRLEKELSSFKEIDLNYNFNNSRDNVQKVLEGSIDIAIAADASDYPDLVKIKLWKEYIGLYSKDGKLKDTLLYNSNMLFASRAIKLITPDHKRMVNDYNILYSILKRSNFMGLLPNPIADNEKKIKLIQKIGSDIEISLVYRADKIKTKGFKKLIELIKKSAR